jgi:hypothetical protein
MRCLALKRSLQPLSGSGVAERWVLRLKSASHTVYTMKRLARVIGLVAGITGVAYAQPAPKDFLLNQPSGSIAFRLGYLG